MSREAFLYGTGRGHDETRDGLHGAARWCCFLGSGVAGARCAECESMLEKVVVESAIKVVILFVNARLVAAAFGRISKVVVLSYLPEQTYHLLERS